MGSTVFLDLFKIFKYSVTNVLPRNLIRSTLKYNQISNYLEVCGDKYDLHDKNVFVIGMGKAVQQMAYEVEYMLNSKIKEGIVSIPVGSFTNNSKNQNMHYYEGAENNLPDSQAVSTAEKVQNLVTKLGHNDILLVLISGGGSALLPLPKYPITLQEKTMFIKKLANVGADITELNTVRKCISELKGGQLAIKAQPAQVVALILSDIVGDPLDLIASGPTVENTQNVSDAMNIIKKYQMFDCTPESIKNILNDIKLNPFPEHNVKNYIIGSNKLCIAAAADEAKNLNYIAAIISNSITGHVTDIARKYVLLTKIVCNFLSHKIDSEKLNQEVDSLNLSGISKNLIENIKHFDNTKKGICLILGGETTVEVKGNGKGGRNQQIALEFSAAVHAVKAAFTGFNIYFLSAGTDGIDGPTDAAGALGYLDLVTDAENDNFDVQKYMENNDSYNFFKKFKSGDLHVITGHTNTNVMDIHIILITNTVR